MPVKKKVAPVEKTSIEEIVGKPAKTAEETPVPVVEPVAKEPEITAEPVQSTHVEPRPVATREYQDRYEQQSVPTQVVKGFLDIQPKVTAFYDRALFLRNAIFIFPSRKSGALCLGRGI